MSADPADLVPAPAWLTEVVDEAGWQSLTGLMTEDEAVALIIAEVRRHPEYGEQLVRAEFGRLLDEWIAENRPPA